MPRSFSRVGHIKLSCRGRYPEQRRSSSLVHPSFKMQSLRIIQDEHRSLAAVLHGMLYLVHEIRDRGAKPDFGLLGAMIYYIDTVPERFHHPKEEQYLFWLLRARHPSTAPLLDRLKLEHQTSAEKIPDPRTSDGALSARRCAGIPRLPDGSGVLCDVPLAAYENRGKSRYRRLQRSISPRELTGMRSMRPFSVTPILC